MTVPVRSSPQHTHFYRYTGCLQLQDIPQEKVFHLLSESGYVLSAAVVFCPRLILNADPGLFVRWYVSTVNDCLSPEIIR